MKIITHLLFLALTFVYSAGHASAQIRSFTVSGTVIDGETSETVPLIYAHLEEINRNTVANINGFFELKNIPSGTYTLTIHRIGYKTYSQKINVADEDLNVDVKIYVSVYGADEIEVLGTTDEFSGSNLEHASKSIFGADLRRSLGSTLSQTLSTIPGFDQRSNGAAPGRPVIRGLGGERVIILQDGIGSGDISAQSSDHAVTIDPENSAEIEIARGPAALAFGANAIGGIINIVKHQIPTTSPSEANGTVSLSGQSVNSGVSAGISTIIPIGTFALQTNLGGRYAGDTRTPVGAISNTDFKSTNNSLGLSYVRPWGYTGVSANMFRSVYGIPPNPNGHTEGVSVDMRKMQYDTKSEIILNRPLLRLIEINASFIDYEHKEIEGKDDHGHEVVGTEFFMRTSNAEVRLKHNKIGLLTDGSGGISAQFVDYAVLGTGMPHASNLNIGSHIIEEADFGNLHMEAGLRYDFVHTFSRSDEPFYPVGILTGAIDSTSYKNRVFNAVSGSTTLIYSFSRSLSAEISVMRSFRAPSLEELYSEGPHLASYSYDIGNPDLKAERAWAKELSLRYKRKNLNLEISAYHNSFDNYIFAMNTGQPNVRRADLLDYQTRGTKARLYGMEFQAEIKPIRFITAQVSVTQTIADRKEISPVGTVSRVPLPFIPPLKSKLILKYENGFFEAGSQVVKALKQTKIDEFETITPGYTTVDIFAQYRVQGKKLLHTFSLNMNNLLNTEYYNHLSRIKDLSPEAGRNISALYRIYF